MNPLNAIRHGESMKIIRKSIVALLLPSVISCSGSLTATLDTIPADGKSRGEVMFHHPLLGGGDRLEGPFGEEKSISVITRRKEARREVVVFQSTRLPGRVLFAAGGRKLYLTFYKIPPDIDGDGFPDEAELDTEADRLAFREWFVRIADSQFLKKSGGWSGEQRDCSGLIRFAYREALKKHDERWQRSTGIVLDKNLPDVRKYNYPAVPMLGTKIFKRAKGPADDMRSFGSFADTESLARYNTVLVTRRIAESRKGDLLFFQNIVNRESPFHAMIVAENEGGRVAVIYHTGRGDVLKRVPASYLDSSRRFRPVEGDENFLGVHRFHILE
jgi:uncharacterized protein YfaT (DUF1175 family)